MTNFEIRYKLVDYNGDPYKNKYGHTEFQNISEEDKEIFIYTSPYYLEEYLKLIS